MPKYPEPVPRGRNVRLPVETNAKLERAAQEDGVTPSHVIRDALADHLARRAAVRLAPRDTAA